jgi:hypothetical protein
LQETPRGRCANCVARLARSYAIRATPQVLALQRVGSREQAGHDSQEVAVEARGRFRHGRRRVHGGAQPSQPNTPYPAQREERNVNDEVMTVEQVIRAFDIAWSRNDEFRSPVSKGDELYSVDVIEMRGGKIQSLRAYLGWRPLMALTSG